MSIKYVSIDIETTGRDPNKHSVLEIGAVIANSHDNRVIGKFHRVILHTLADLIWDDVAKDMNEEWYIRAKMNDNEPRCSKGRVLLELAGWLKINGVDPMKVWATGKNFGSFDLQFLNRLPGYNEAVKFKHRFLDPGTLYFDPEWDEEIPSSDVCMVRANLPGNVKHRALQDAEMVVMLLKTAWERKK